MNKYIVTVEYWPIVLGKNEIFKVETELTKEEVENKVLKEREEGNNGFEVYVNVETIDEYLSDIETEEIK